MTLLQYFINGNFVIDLVEIIIKKGKCFVVTIISKVNDYPDIKRKRLVM